MFFHFAACTACCLRRIFTALFFHFQCFGPLLLWFIVCWRLFSSRAFLFLQLLFHFDYLCFFVHLRRSEQSNPLGNVMICSFRFIHSISKIFFFKDAWPFVSILFDVAVKLFRFIMWISLEWFNRKCRSNFISLYFLRVHSTFTMRFVLWMYPALFWAPFKESSICWWKTIWEGYLAWNFHR